MKRYDILKGDKTDAGGTIESGQPNDKTSHHEQAYENDPVWCPACKTMGKIACVGARSLTKGPDGREAALSDDLCVCQCKPSPKLVASQHISYIDV